MLPAHASLRNRIPGSVRAPQPAALFLIIPMASAPFAPLLSQGSRAHPTHHTRPHTTGRCWGPARVSQHQLPPPHPPTNTRAGPGVALCKMRGQIMPKRGPTYITPRGVGPGRCLTPFNPLAACRCNPANPTGRQQGANPPPSSPDLSPPPRLLCATSDHPRVAKPAVIVSCLASMTCTSPLPTGPSP